MSRSGTPLIRAPGRFSEKASDGLVKGKCRLRQLPIVGSTFSKLFKKLPLQTGSVTNIIITSLSYTGMCRARDKSSLELRGTKFDFVLLLRHFDYRHEGNSVDFTLLNDFDVDFTDSTGIRKVIPKVDTSRDSIRRTIQRIMRTAERDAKIVFYFGGHGEHAEVNMMNGNSGDECDFQTIIAGDGLGIYGKELQAWFCTAQHPSVVVMAIFDACHSGGSLGLPYTYGTKGCRASADKTHRIRLPISIIQISATQPNQIARSNEYKDGYNGRLTYSLVQYLRGDRSHTIEDLADYLSRKCDPSGNQLPQVCCSRKYKGSISFFNLKPFKK